MEAAVLTCLYCKAELDEDGGAGCPVAPSGKHWAKDPDTPTLNPPYGIYNVNYYEGP